MKQAWQAPKAEGASLPYAPVPIVVPPGLLDAFQALGDPSAVLVGGSATQVWTGCKDGIFETGDLDFITHLAVTDLARSGAAFVASGRHAVFDGVPVEFPSGPLAVGDHVFVPGEAAVPVPTVDGRTILCLRPEACVLDRLAWVAAEGLPQAYGQAFGVGISQWAHRDWDGEWIDRVAASAGLAKVWAHLKADLVRGDVDEASLAAALTLGWG